jgi:acetylornithine/N-succinyldiaminopimelate aminotransferase
MILYAACARSATNAACCCVSTKCTGKLYAYEHYGVAPDILASAKGIGGGFPLGAVLATAEAAKGMGVGSHGSTYGGNPLAMACGNAVFDVIQAPGFLDDVARKGLILRQSLAALAAGNPDVVEEIRGEGLMQGLKLRVPNTDFAAAARAEKIIVIPAGENVVRIVPPLVISEDELKEGVRRLEAACRHFKNASAPLGTQGAKA